MHCFDASVNILVIINTCCVNLVVGSEVNASVMLTKCDF